MSTRRTRQRQRRLTRRSLSPAYRRGPSQLLTNVTMMTLLTRPVVLELVVTDTTGGVEVTPEESFDRIVVGQSFAFTLYETACHAIARWRLEEQSRRLPDPVPPPSQMEY